MKSVSKYLLLLLLLFSLLPYFIICFHALPFADDFCFGWTASEKIPFVQKFLNQYLRWNGRYTADILVNLHPLVTGKILVYQLSLFLSLLATPITLALFIQQIIKDKIAALIATLFITLFYLNYLPNLTEGIYWYIGITNYHLGNLLLLLQLTSFIQSLSAKGKAKILFQFSSLSLLIISVGFNEIGAILIPLFYFSIIIFYSKPEAATRKYLILHFLVAITASAFVLFSPGNFSRGGLFAHKYDLFHSTLYSLLQTIRFMAKWVFSVPFVVLSVIIVAFADKIENKFLRETDYRIVFAATIFTVFIGSFLPYFATGMLGQHRTINYVFFFFILLWIIFLLSVSNKFFLFKKFVCLKNEKTIFLLLLTSIFFVFISGNTLKIISDWRHDNFRKYETDFYTRQSAVLKNTALSIQPLTQIPKTFQITDAKKDSGWWVDKCMRNFYEESKAELK